MYNDPYLIKAICTYCGAANLQSSLECRKCGAPLVEQVKPAPAPAVPQIQIREGEDEVNAFEAKAAFAANMWLKQVIDWKQILYDHCRFDIPRSGILTQLKIIFNREWQEGAWRLRLITGAEIILEDRANRGGRIEVIRRLTDTEMHPNMRLEFQYSFKQCPLDEGAVIEMTRWIPTGKQGSEAIDRTMRGKNLRGARGQSFAPILRSQPCL